VIWLTSTKQRWYILKVLQMECQHEVFYFIEVRDSLYIARLVFLQGIWVCIL